MGLIYPNDGSLELAGYLQTDLALATAHLWQLGLAVGKGTTLAQLVAAEATYDGYSALTIATWNAPYLDPSGGASIWTGGQQFNYVYSAGITNTIGGFWVQSAASRLLMVGTFDSPVPMIANGRSIPLSVLLNGFA